MKRTHSKAQLVVRQPAKASKIARKPIVVMDVEQRTKKRRNSVAISVEKKFLDTNLSNTALVAAGTMAGGELDPATFLCLTSPAQGDGESNRDGKQIIGKYLVVKGQIFMIPNESSLNPPASTQVYLACVLDTQTNQAQLNSEDVYKNVGADVGVNATPLRNLVFGKRFRILKEETFIFENTNFNRTAANDFTRTSRCAMFDWYIPLKDLKINFSSTTTGVVGNVIDNSCHIIGFADTAADSPTISYQARFRFVG